jgi:hypothetical protein
MAAVAGPGVGYATLVAPLITAGFRPAERVAAGAAAVGMVIAALAPSRPAPAPRPRALTDVRPG